MHLVNLIATFLLIWAARASPRDQEATSSPCTESQYGATTTIEGSLTVTTFSRSTAASTSTSVGPLTLPTSALTVVAARSSSPIHFAPMNAAGLRFYLGAQTLSFCPSEVVDEGACPTGNETAFGLCNMAVMVPGGQQLYITPQGEIGYTEAHSALIPAGSLSCPFTYFKAPGATFGYLGSQGFGATGLMACPTNGHLWQVFANMRNATVPLGNVSQCLGFDALALDFSENYGAWEYT